MAHFQLRGTYRNAMPFADWLANVDRRIERRTGQRLMTNQAPNDYWQSLFHCGESFQSAADEFIADWRGQ